MVRLVGSVILVRLLQPANAKLPIVATLLGRVMLVNWEQLSKAFSPIAVTLPGSVTLVMEVIPLKASSPILVTGKPPNVPGITTSPPVPVYPVTVASLPTTVKVKDCAKAGTNEPAQKIESQPAITQLEKVLGNRT